MKIDKIKKLNRQGKIFSVLLYIFSIILGIILSLFLFCSIITPLFTTLWSFVIILLTAFACVYILPALGIIALLLLILYLVKLSMYKGERRQKIFRTVLSSVLLIAMLSGSFVTFVKYGLSNTYEMKVESKISEISDLEIKDNLISMLEHEDITNINDTYVKKIILIANLSFRETIYYRDDNGISKTYSSLVDDTDYSYIRDKSNEITFFTQLTYIILLALSIISLVFWHDNLLKQYKFMIQEAINKERENKGEREEKETLTENEIKASGKRKIITTLIIIVACVVVIGIVYAIIEAKREAETRERLEILNQIENNNIAEEEKQEEYSYFSDEKNGIRIEMRYPFRDRCTVEIYKTKDGRETWNEIDSNIGSVYVGTEFMFISEDIGFCHDPHGGVDSYASLQITTDGGYTWEEVKVNKPDVITENNIFFKDLPRAEGEKLTVVAYTVRLNRWPNEKYYMFESTDSGKTWNFVKELQY